MPKVWVEPVKLILPRDNTRTVGLHVSEVIRDLAVGGGILDKKWVKEIAIELQDTNMMQCGFAWESYLEWSNQHPEIEYHPGELRVATHICAICGISAENHLESEHEFVTLYIYMSPDGFSYDEWGVLMFLHEIKFTKKSCRDFADGIRMGSKKSIMWIWQIAAYLKAVNQLRAKLHVMFINGNYSFKEDDPQSGAVPMIFRLEFSQNEIDRTWRMLEEHAAVMVRNGKYKHAA